MVISSVAGDRGRCSNYYYGASKAAMSAYLSGLRVRLFRCGVYVINIKLGYVKTTTNIDAAGDLNLSNN